MKFTPRPTARLAAMLVAMLTAATAVAQNAAPAEAPRPTLPADIYQVAGPFTPEQQQAVTTYVDFYINRLITGSDNEVVSARAELIGPLAKGGSNEFNNQYSAILAQRLAASPAMQSQPRPHPPEAENPTEQRGGVIVRLNTMIVTSRLNKDEHVVSLILTGIKDENPAVRYWAVRAVRGNVETLNAQQRQPLVAALQQMVGGEQADEVLRVLLGALIELDAVNPVVAALNDLIKLHNGNPRLTYDAKRDAMRSLLQKLQVLNAQNQAVGPQFQQLARAACRYMILISQQAQGANLDPLIAADHIEMVRLCDLVLRTVHQQLGSAVAQPPSIQASLARQDWPALQAAALTWRETLKQPPFNFADVDLSPAGGG